MQSILITGICGFVGSTLAKELIKAGHTVIGIDNLIRPGSQLNVAPLKALGIEVLNGDIRYEADLESIPKVDWVLDCAANASVLAGVDGKTSSRELVDHNLLGTINLLEYCQKHQAGFILLSTSRVYSIAPLTQLKLKVEDKAGKNRYTPNQEPRTKNQELLTQNGLTEAFPTTAPISLYGATKLTSEQLALEYGYTYDFPVWINRCGVMAGAGQFGHPAQGIFAYWIHSFAEGKPLKYIGFDGQGRQVRDCLHPRDLLPLLEKQFATRNQQATKPRVVNCAGGAQNSMSLAELTAWCNERFNMSVEPRHDPQDRPFDIPWMVLDSSLAHKTWNWAPQTSVTEVCEEIAQFAEKNPNWLGISEA
jgi:CDP-paratose 2-epimerase